MPDCDCGCCQEQRITAMEAALKSHKEHNSGQHSGFFERLKALEIQGARAEAVYTQILARLDSLDEKVEEMAMKPAKRWDSLVASALSAIAGAFIAWMIARGAG